MNFKNTYINTSGLSIPELKDLANKYSKVTGCEQEEYLSRLDHTWPVMRCNEDTVYVVVNLNRESATEITEQDLDNYLENTMNYPTFDFKINLSNMSEAEKEVAKAWLASVAESRKMGLGALEEDDFAEYYWCIKSNYNVTGTEEIDGRYYFSDTKTTELFLTFSKPTITSWEAPSKKSEKELQLEELVGKLQQQLKEAEQQLENLK